MTTTTREITFTYLGIEWTVDVTEDSGDRVTPPSVEIVTITAAEYAENGMVPDLQEMMHEDLIQWVAVKPRKGQAIPGQLWQDLEEGVVEYAVER